MNLGDHFDINLALTDMEQYILDTNPFLDPLSPVHVKDALLEVFLQSPLFRQVHRLMQIISESEPAGVKFTQAGNLPGPVVRELYALGVPEWQVEEYYKSLSSETKCFSVGFAKIVALHCKLIRRYKGRFLLSKKGATLLDSPREMFALILNALCTDFNFGYFDGFDEMPGNFTGTAAMYLLFHQSGHEWLMNFASSSATCTSSASSRHNLASPPSHSTTWNPHPFALRLSLTTSSASASPSPTLGSRTQPH